MRLQRAVPDRHDVAVADEDVGLAELEADAARQELRRPQDDEERSFVVLELGALVGAKRVLDGQVVQAELALHLAQDFFARLVQADPDEPVRVRERLADVADRQVGDPPAAGVGRAVDDPGRGDVFAIVCIGMHARIDAPDIMAGSDEWERI